MTSADGYSWSGDLAETNIRSLYATCHSLRFSGRLELQDGPTRAEIQFLGGDPVEIDGGDTQQIALWNQGAFRAVQGIPNLDGELTGQREVAGSLAVVKPTALFSWASEYRLSCELELERPGDKAVVSFTHGHAESAVVNGQPELAALARVSSWNDGNFHVKLKPLFGGTAVPAASPVPEPQPLEKRQFDVSRSIPMDLKQKANVDAAVARAKASAEAAGGATRQRRETELVTPLAMPGGHPAPSPKKGGGAAIWVTLLALLVAGGVVALYWFHLPPFSPPPRPLDDKKPADTAGGDTTAKPDTKPEARPDTKPEATPDTKPEAKTEPKADGKPVQKGDGDGKPEAKPDGKPDAKDGPVSARDHEKAEKLGQKARLLLVEGHEHTAGEVVHKALKLDPKDPTLLTIEQQALGTLGRAEVSLEGKGNITIDGHKFAVPRKLKLPAGPHVVSGVDGIDENGELVLKRNEKRKLRAKH